MKYRVELSLEAQADADSILEWLAEQEAGRTGINWFLRLEDAIASLGAMPARCPKTPDAILADHGVRELRFGRSRNVYRILFKIDGDRVVILKIRHASREH